jgi:hypothetical protein
MTSDEDRDPAGREPAAAGQPGRDAPDHARAEIYLRLRAEAELRRVEALPRPDPLAQAGVPPALRRPVRLGLRVAETVEPAARSAAGTLRPVAEDAGRALRPVADHAARTLQPLIENAVQALRPFAEKAGRTLEPLARRAVGTALPAMNEAAGRLHPPAWQLIDRLRGLGRPDRSRSFYSGSLAGDDPGGEPSPEEGVQRLRVVALALTDAGAIDPATATSIVADLETALLARSRISHGHLLPSSMLARPRRGPLPDGRYLAAPIGVLLPQAPGQGPAHTRLFALVAGPDRAIVTIAGRTAVDPEDQSLHLDPWPIFGAGGPPAVTDDRGAPYELDEDSCSSSGDGEWAGTLNLSPVPPAGVRWLEITPGPGSAPVRVDLTGMEPRASTAVAAIHPAERFFHNAALNLLDVAMASGPRHPIRHGLSDVADVVTALDAVGVLDPARGAVGRLVALARHLGMAIPPELGAVATAAEDLPAAWADILEHRGCQDGPRADAAVAAMLPEIDGARFALAGLSSHADAAELRVVSWGSQITPRFVRYTAANPWSWQARDDRGRWHLVTESSGSFNDHHADMQLTLLPPLHPDATSLDVTLTGPSAQVTVTVPLNWQEPA